MATEVVHIIDPDAGTGYDYDSLYDWEAGEQGNLTGARDEISIATCRSTAGTADTTIFYIDGWTTSATQYIKIWTDPDETYRHNGEWSTGNKYRLEITNQNAAIRIGHHNIKIIGLQFQLTENRGDWSGGCGISSAWDYAGELVVAQCIFKGITSSSPDYFVAISFNAVYPNGGGIYIYNNSFTVNTTGFRREGILITGGGQAGTVYCYNNTFKNFIKGVYYTNNADIDLYVANCGFVNCTDAFTPDAPTGTTSNSTSTPTFASGKEFTLASNDTTWKGQGTNLYNDANLPFQTDIMGNDRGGALATVWDIGAHEYTAGEVIKVIDPDAGTGHDYHSLSDWEAGEQKNLVNNGEISVAKCRTTGGTADTTSFTIDGWTTGATQYIKIWTDPAESYRHSGKWNTSKYRLSDSMSPITINSSNVKVFGIQVDLIYDGASNRNGIQIEASLSDIHIAHNIIRMTGTTSAEGDGVYCTSSDTQIFIYNNIIYDFPDYLIRGASADGTAYIFNNTLVSGEVGMYSNYNGVIAKNNLIKCVTAASGTFAAGTDYNATNNASMDYSVTGSGNAHDRVSQTFTFVDEGADDFHLASNDAGAKGYGTNSVGGLFTTDIDGQSRGTVWDIGADECVLAAISGTATASITKSDIVTGGKTIIITLIGDTWIAGA